MQRAMRDLERLRRQHPGVTSADMYTLAGATAVEAMGGPYIPWRPGRADANSGISSPPNGRLPGATKVCNRRSLTVRFCSCSQGAEEIRQVFDRLGFTETDAVALIGAHVLGRAHPRNSNFTGPWTRRNRVFTNDFYRFV